MKKYSESELQELSQAVFAEHPQADKLLATRDGNFFLPEKHIAAHNHAFNNGGLDVYEILRPGSKEKNEEECSYAFLKTEATNRGYEGSLKKVDLLEFFNKEGVTMETLLKLENESKTEE